MKEEYQSKNYSDHDVKMWRQHEFISTERRWPSRNIFVQFICFMIFNFDFHILSALLAGQTVPFLVCKRKRTKGW